MKEADPGNGLESHGNQHFITFEPLAQTLRAKIWCWKAKYIECQNYFIATSRRALRGVGFTLSPSCRLYEPEAGLEALRAGSGAGGQGGLEP